MIKMIAKTKASHLLATTVLWLSALAPLHSATASAGDHQRATQAVESGEILPLRKILERIEPTHPGQVLEVELEQKKGGWVYELKILKAGGRLQKIKVDAKNGVIISDKER